MNDSQEQTGLDIFWMQHALELANRAESEGEVPVGAIVVYEDRVIGEGWNRPIVDNDPTAHAEMIVITQAAAHLKNERLNDCTLYVTIEPCTMCMGAAVLARIKTIVFGAWDPKTGACGSALDLTKSGLYNHTIEITGGVLEAECRTILQEFFLDKR